MPIINEVNAALPFVQTIDESDEHEASVCVVCVLNQLENGYGFAAYQFFAQSAKNPRSGPQGHTISVSGLVSHLLPHAIHPEPSSFSEGNRRFAGFKLRWSLQTLYYCC